MSRGRNLIRRRKKLTILLDGSGNRTVNSTGSRKECLAEYDPSIFVQVCKRHWETWLTVVEQERKKLMEHVGQYPEIGVVGDLGDLMELGRIHEKMKQVIIDRDIPITIKYSFEFCHPGCGD